MLQYQCIDICRPALQELRKTASCSQSIVSVAYQPARTTIKLLYLRRIFSPQSKDDRRQILWVCRFLAAAWCFSPALSVSIARYWFATSRFELRAAGPLLDLPSMNRRLICNPYPTRTITLTKREDLTNILRASDLASFASQFFCPKGTHSILRR